MNICVNAIPLSGLMTGVARYVRSLYQEIEQTSDVTALYYTGADLALKMPSQADYKTWSKRTDRIWSLPDPVVTGLRALHWLRFESHLRSKLSSSVAHVYHETTFTPANIHQKIPQVFTLYDLSLLRYREMHPRERVWFADLFFKRRIPEASHIITISSFIRNEAIELLGIPEDRITAIPLAPAPHFEKKSAEEYERVRRKYNLPEKYFLFVGTLEPRKNLDTVVAALSKCEGRHHVVLTGWKGWGAKEWQQKAQHAGVADRIHCTDYLPEVDLPGLYSGAIALVYLSHYEGFGLPVVEAMACGCPVICSNVASLPEAGGDAAYYIDAEEKDEVGIVMDQLASDTTLRNDMIHKGIMHASTLTWKRTAQETVKIFSQVAEAARG